MDLRTGPAAAHSDTSGLVYKPTDTDLTVDLSVFAPDAVAIRWLDPSDGTYRDVGSFTTSGTVKVEHPGDNAGGDPDWVLVVEAV